MLFKQNIPLAIQGIILTSLLTLLASCGNSAALEGLVSADPKLKENKTEQSSKTNQSTAQSTQNSPPLTNQDSETLDTKSKAAEENQNATNVATKNQSPDNQGAPQSSIEFEGLLPNFPDFFPVYPQAELQEIKSPRDDSSGILIWHTTDNRQAVANFYQAELLANNWEIIKPFNINPQHPKIRAIAVKDDLKVDLTIVQSATKENPEQAVTELALAYQPVSQVSQETTAESESSIPETSNQALTEDTSPQSPALRDESESFDTTETNNNYFDSEDEDFTDLEEVPEQLQQPLQSVAALSILTPYTGKANVELTKFAPNEIVTRGEYARWLIAANNRYYNDDPGKKIFVAAKTNQPAFKDIKAQHPDFEAIQSLAEAGLIPSRLTEDSTNLMFRPDAPLTREDLITWKVPLDTRQSLPKASLEAIEESWGFQDAANTDSAAVRALYADFQNGDRSNIRRIFGYTTLFQPKKPVTRAEAAASLSYFGFQGDGITAREILDAETETETES
ncbi:MAG: S-layer homology domain-containing protein [Cyanobacteria bacterium J06638_38]